MHEASAVIALFLASCAGDGGAQLIVEVQTDLRTGVDFVDIRTTLTRSAGLAPERDVLIPAPAARDLSTGLRVAEFAGLQGGPVRVEVALLTETGEVFASRGSTVDVAGSQAIMVSVTRTCAGVLCPMALDGPEQSDCLGGRCVTPDCAAGVIDACETPSLPLIDLLRQSVAATCEMVTNCTGAVADVVFRGNDCPTIVGRAYEELMIPLLVQALGAGSIIYDGQRAFGCLNALRTDCRSFVLTKQNLECTQAITGTVEIGGACRTDFECAGVGSFCSLGSSCPGVCAPRLSVGEACEGQNSCKPGLMCSESGTCNEVIADGESCSLTLSDCGFGSLCTSAGTSRPVCRGATTLFSADIGARCGELVGVYCGPGLSCTLGESDPRCVARSTSGAACLFGTPDPCPSDERCDTLLNRCVPLPSAGDFCADVDGRSQCASGNACDLDSGMCFALSGIGATCEVAAQCSLAFCAGECLGPCI